MPPSPRTNRGPSAAAENHRALIDAARSVFAESGFAAPLSAIAQRAGVGQGSMYRHFPDRISLAVAVFEDNVTALEALAARPDATLDDLLDLISAQAVASTALIDTIAHAGSDAGALRIGARVEALVARMLAADQAAGRVDPEVDPADVMVAVSMLALAIGRMGAVGPETPERARRLIRRALAR